MDIYYWPITIPFDDLNDLYMDGVFIHVSEQICRTDHGPKMSHGGSSEDGRTDLGRTAAAVVATSKAPAVSPNVNLPLWENSWWFLRGFFWINFKYILIYLNQFFLDLVNSLWFLFVVVALFFGRISLFRSPTCCILVELLHVEVTLTGKTWLSRKRSFRSIPVAYFFE